MKASKRHLDMLAKRGKFKTLFASSKKTPGVRQLRKDVLKRVKEGKSYQQAVTEAAKERQHDKRIDEGNGDLACDVPVVADATGGETSGA